jgi:hypothetical protein
MRLEPTRSLDVERSCLQWKKKSRRGRGKLLAKKPELEVERSCSGKVRCAVADPLPIAAGVLESS